MDTFEWWIALLSLPDTMLYIQGDIGIWYSCPDPNEPFHVHEYFFDSNHWASSLKK